MTFEKFIDPDYFPNEKVVLYVVRDNDQIFYVGISKSNVWYRWFGANGRVIKNVYDEWISYDSIGNHIIRNMLKSFMWEVDLWTASDVGNPFVAEVTVGLAVGQDIPDQFQQTLCHAYTTDLECIFLDSQIPFIHR